jgi:hypothetical protein
LAIPTSKRFKARCPVCKNIFVIEDTAGQEFVRCSTCGNKLKVPGSISKRSSGPEPSLPKFREVPSTDIRVGPITLRNTRPLIRTIVVKDIRGSLKFLLILLLFGIILAMIMSPLASTAPDHDEYLEDIEDDPDDPEAKEDEIKAVETNDINNQFGIAIFFTALIFVSIAQTLYGSEVKKGTIRSIALYPIDMNGITIAKIISISLISGMILFSIFFLPVLPFYFSNTFPNFPGIIFMAYFVSVIFLIVIAFASHILTYFFKNIKFSLNRLVVIFTIFGIIFTETVLKFIGWIYLSTSRLSGSEADNFLESWSETAQSLSVLSPYHGFGRMLSSMYGFNTGGFDFFIIGPIGLLLLVFGFTLGKKIYLDVFNLD